MSRKEFNQIDFSVILFDTLFGLVLFFGLDSFLEIKDPYHFIFYLFSTIILLDWWLGFKSADDAFDEEVTNSAADLVFGIVDIILIEYIILSAKSFNYTAALSFLIALLTVDLVWALAWKYIGKWKTKDQFRIKAMEKELSSNILINIFALCIFGILLFLVPALSVPQFVSFFIAFYLVYIVLNFKYKIIDIQIF